MNYIYPKVAVCLCAILTLAWDTSISANPTFVDCAQEPIQLCVEDAGVRLPANNKLFLGENHPDATSCSVHISRQTSVETTCAGDLTYEVIIYLFESADPVLLRASTTITPDSLLTAVLSFDSEVAADDVIRINGIPYTTGCARYHRIVWTVTDACGESSECEMLIDVYDCSIPIHTANALQILTSTTLGYLDLHLSDFVIPSSDDCTSSGNYMFSFSPDFHVPDSLFNICDFDAWGVEIAYPIWIADAGRDLNCDGVITWDERQIVAHFIYIVIIESGNVDCSPDCYFGVEVTDQSGRGIKNVEVNIASNIHVDTLLTNVNGSVMKLIPGSLITFDLSKSDFHKNGVSTLDLIKVQKHLLGIQSFTHPYNFFAADANSSLHVSAVDLIIMRKIILNILDEFPGGQSWKFFRKDHVFPDIMDMWMVVPGLDTFINCQSQLPEYIGIKIGDLNNTAEPLANSILPRKDYPVVNWVTWEQHYKKGEEIEIPIYAGSFKSMQGFQLTFSSPDLEFLNVHSDIMDLEESFAIFGNHLTMSWIDLAALYTEEDDILFTLHAKAQRDGNIRESLSLNSDITRAEMYTPDEEIFIPQLLIRSDQQESLATPNPWSDKTSLSFALNKSGHVELDIINIDGKLIYSTSNFFPRGNNQFEIMASDFDEKGLLFYQVHTQDYTVTGKMMKL